MGVAARRSSVSIIFCKTVSWFANITWDMVEAIITVQQRKGKAMTNTSLHDCCCLVWLQQGWQQRLNRVEALAQQQSDRAQAQAAAQDATIAHLRSQLDSLSQTVRNLDESLSKLRSQKSSLGSDYESLQLERQQLIGDGQQLRAHVQQLEASVNSLRHNLQQVGSIAASDYQLTAEIVLGQQWTKVICLTFTQRLPNTLLHCLTSALAICVIQNEADLCNLAQTSRRRRACMMPHVQSLRHKCDSNLALCLPGYWLAKAGALHDCHFLHIGVSLLLQRDDLMGR